MKAKQGQRSRLSELVHRTVEWFKCSRAAVAPGPCAWCGAAIGLLLAAASLFFAGDIRDRYLSARWKTFFDRSFFRGHAPSLTGKQLAWVVAGPLQLLPNLRRSWRATPKCMARIF